ncbi:hypothetical protein TYRP_015300 [Tyrophagus putrescentiae]|nr:hypothetical protein TYRP_015300 [Tyrophagus putrescentiae]
MVKLNSTSINQLNCLEHLSELRLSHVAVNLADCFTQKAAHYLLPQMGKLKTLYLSQVAPWPRIVKSAESSSKNSSLYIESSTEGKCWQAVASIFPHLTSLNVRVKQSSVSVISKLLNGFYNTESTKISVYSAAEQCTEYFGHRKRYQVNSRTKGGIFFSECFFERVNQL